MTCPHCNHSFPLTWRRYASSPTGKHICPSCNRVSKFKWTVAYITLVTVAWIAFVAIVFVVTVFVLPQTWHRMVGPEYFVILYLAGCVVLIPLDRYFDERFRKLEKSKDETIDA
jgi:membrane protein YdbS with pleckstrin-like domain